MSYKQLLYLDKSKATLTNNKYVFNLNNFLITEYRIKKYIVYGIDMATDITYLCIPQLAKHTVNRNVYSGEGSTDIVAVVTNDSEIDPDRHTMFLQKEKEFRKLTIYFRKSDGTFVNPSNFVVVLDCSNVV